jgi:hypothetical protein
MGLSANRARFRPGSLSQRALPKEPYSKVIAALDKHDSAYLVPQDDPGVVAPVSGAFL